MIGQTTVNKFMENKNDILAQLHAENASITRLTGEIDAARTALSTDKASLAQAQAQLTTLTGEIEVLEQELCDVNAKLGESEAQIALLEASQDFDPKFRAAFARLGVSAHAAVGLPPMKKSGGDTETNLTARCAAEKGMA